MPCFQPIIARKACFVYRASHVVQVLVCDIAFYVPGALWLSSDS